MRILHIIKTKPDPCTKELVQPESDSAQIKLYEKPVDYDKLLDDLFSYDKVICWW
ncbi:MAG: hypothetical protein HQK83_16240 [Fibrobacteria bacterium]|nr:hypothetical protein [Fibrobacteria bacterium]